MTYARRSSRTMAHRRLLGLGLLFAASVSVPAVALAQGSAAASYPDCKNKTVSSAESERAHAIYSAGRVRYDEKDYDAAIQQFREAYSRDCTKHDLLVIISAAYERRGDRVEAVRALRAYLERVPDSPDRRTHEKQIENLERMIREQNAAPAPPPPPPTSTTPPPAREERSHTPYPWVVVGLGGLAIAVGAVVYAVAPSLPGDCDVNSFKCVRKSGESSDEFNKRQDEANRSQNQPTAGIIVMASGGALVLGGLVWHFLEPTGPRDKARLQPAVGPGYGGVALGGSF